jgi:hypothetical protein
MLYQEIDLAHLYTIGPYNGTRPVTNYRIDETTTLIGIENVAMVGSRWTLRGVPSPTPAVDSARAQPDVVASLERSLKEHADVWAELSEY